MSKKCKYTISICILTCICLLGSGIYYYLKIQGVFTPYFALEGPSKVEMDVNHGYKELGFQAVSKFQNIEEEVIIHENLDTTKIGEYKIIYELPHVQKKLQRIVIVKDKAPPNLTLKGKKTIRMFAGETFEDPGFEAIDAYEKDLTQKVEVNMDQVKFDEVGNYKIIYCVEDSSGNRSEVERKIEICQDPTKVTLEYNYDSYDNKKEEWWLKKNNKHERILAARDEAFLKKYDAYYMGEDKKVIYLTYDEGGNDITYIKQIADVLNKHDVKATFFLTRNYLTNEAEFINELVNNGHVIGNHGWHHYDMPTMANESQIQDFVLEITETEKTYMKVVGQPMKKIFRFPSGSMSERACKIVQDLGYKNYFWSHAFYDYGKDVSKEEAYQSFMNHYHNGAIYLLHPSNKGNYLALEDFILTMKEKGYHFDTVDNISK